jgi:hypothetical protein
MSVHRRRFVMSLIAAALTLVAALAVAAPASR